MSPLTIQQIAKSFVVAMAMLHCKGLVHLDMKPENILVSTNSDGHGKSIGT